MFWRDEAPLLLLLAHAAFPPSSSWDSSSSCLFSVLVSANCHISSGTSLVRQHSLPPSKVPRRTLALDNYPLSHKYDHDKGPQVEPIVPGGSAIPSVDHVPQRSNSLATSRLAEQDGCHQWPVETLVLLVEGVLASGRLCLGPAHHQMACSVDPSRVGAAVA